MFNYYEQAEHKVTAVNSLRFFRRELNLRYTGIVHNQIDIPDNLQITRAGISVKHLGYDLDEKSMERKFHRTRELLEKQLDENPDFAFAWFNLAQLYRGRIFDDREKFGKLIIEAATRAVELSSPEDIKTRYVHLMALDQLGWTYLYLEDYKRAEMFARRALEHKENYLDPLILLGHIYANSGRYPEAIAAYQNYLDAQERYDGSRETDALILVHPDSRATALFGIGTAAEVLGDVAQAKESYLQALKETERYLQVPLCLGRIYLNEGNLPEAEKYFKMQLAKKEPSVHAMLGLSYLYSRQDRIEKAESWLLKALELSPENPNVLSQFGQFYLQQNRPYDALRMLEVLRTIVEPDVALMRQLADTYYSVHCYDLAAQMYRDMIEEQPSNSALFNDYANCCFKMEQYELAEQMYRQALEAQAADAAALRNLGLCMLKQNKTTEAIVALERYLEHLPEDFQMKLLLGDIFIQCGHFERAMAYLEDYLRKHAADPGALTRLADCYLFTGHEDSALLGYRQALAIDPNCEPARKKLKELQERVDSVSQA